jgi:chemotaxis protein histidine kinase CheA
MTTPSRLLDFFTLEASEYLGRIEASLAQGSPDIPALQSGARGLRGSATMARSTPIANLAGRLESLAAKISGGDLELNDQLKRVINGTVETLTTLIRSVRSWAPEHDERTRRAMDELDSYVPPDPSQREDLIVPISELFFSDAGPHIIEVASSARTTFEQRLRDKQTKPQAPPLPQPPRPVARTTPSGTGLRGAALRDALGSSIAQMRPLERPGEPAQQAVIPIQNLVYRGQAAVKRSKELRAQILSAPTPPSRDVIAELCDLVELASVE